MLDDVDWVKFYKNWAIEQLYQEIETCHKYQLDIVTRLYKKTIGLSQAINQITLSQHRESLINEAIRDYDHEEDNR